jgi:hypothetical protein
MSGMFACSSCVAQYCESATKIKQWYQANCHYMLRHVISFKFFVREHGVHAGPKDYFVVVVVVVVIRGSI